MLLLAQPRKKPAGTGAGPCSDGVQPQCRELDGEAWTVARDGVGGASRRAPAASRIPTPEMAVPSPVLEAVTALTMANTRCIKGKGSPREHASEIYCRARSPSPQSSKCHGRHRGQAAAKSRRQRKPRAPCGLPSRHSPQLRGTQERFREEGTRTWGGRGVSCQSIN